MIHSNTFYAGLAPRYHLIYQDWDESIKRQGGMLDSVIREMWENVSDVLDVSCGIGTQALGLSGCGYRVMASDLSPEEIDRAEKEADERDLPVSFSVSDMRRAFDHHQRHFDVVISCYNSVPHLLSDEDVLEALEQFHKCTRPGGGCIITIRDYENEDMTKQHVKSYGIREDKGIRWILWQVWDPHPPLYDVTMYFVEDRGGSMCKTYSYRSTYYAIGIPKVMELMQQAGFHDIRRLDDRFFQPMIIGTR